MSLDCLRGLLLAGAHVAPSRRATARMRARSCAGVTPGLAATSIWSKRPALPVHPLRLGQREHADAVAPPKRVDAGELGDADDRVAPARGAAPATRSASPTLQALAVGRRLVDRDLAGASAACGPRRERERLEARGRRIEAMKLGAPPVPMRLPFLSRNVAGVEDRAGGARRRRAGARPARAPRRRSAACVPPCSRAERLAAA